MGSASVTTKTDQRREWSPHATVAAVIMRDSKFLLVEEEIDGRVVLNQPAGHLENNETLVEAIVREVQEETARLFKPECVVGIYQWKNPHKGNTYLRTTFAGSVSSHRPDQPLDEGIIQATWKTLAELQNDQASLRSPLVLASIYDYLAGKKYPIEIFRSGNLLA